MPNIEKVPVGDLPRARDWNALADAYNQGTFGLGSVQGNVNTSPAIVKVKNSSGSDRERFEIMEIDGLVLPLENDGSVDLIFDLDSVSASSESVAVLLGPIEDDKLGFAVIDGPCLALVSGGTGTLATIDAANHRFKPASAGSTKLLNTPHATDTKLIPVILNVAAGTMLYRFTLNAAWSSGVADADILEMDGTDTGIDANVEDPLGIFSSLGIGDEGMCQLQGGKYYVKQAGCPS